MAIEDNATLVAGIGYIYVGATGLAAPTPDKITSFDASTFGSAVYTLTVTGTPTGGSFTVKGAGTDTPASVAYNATPAAVQTAIAGLASVGLGNVKVAGTSLTSGLTITLVGALQGKELTWTVDNTGLTGGTTPAAAIVDTTEPNGWICVGHTSRDEMPEWGYDGGDKELKGSWQNPRLRRVQTSVYEDYVTFQLLQFSEDALQLYYGGDGGSTAGVFSVDKVDYVTNERAILIVIVDGDDKLGFHALKADVARDDSISMPVDDLAALPLKATFLQINGEAVYEWIQEDTFA